MKNRKYQGYIYVMAYLLVLRIVLNITVGISWFNLGTFYDLVMLMFWVGAFGFLTRYLISQKIFYIFVILAATVFVVGDSVYFDYFGVISARSSFAGLKWLQEGNTMEYDIQIPLVAYLITPLFIITTYLIISNKKRDVFYLKDFSFLAIIFIAQVFLYLFWGNQNFDTRLEYYRSDAYLFETMHDRSLYSEKYGYYHYHLLDLTRFRYDPDVDTYVGEVDDYFNEVPSHVENAYSDRYNGYNVVSILGETLETRFIDEKLTPNLYMMMNQGISFENYYTPVFQQGATCNSEYMSLTGLGSITSNDWSNNVCDAYSTNAIPYALPNQLKTVGYNTYYFHSGYEWFYNREVMIPYYGFDTVKFQEDIIEDGYPDFYDRFDTEMMAFLDEYVDYEEPWFMNLLTYSMHGAYNQMEFEDKYGAFLDEQYPDLDVDPEIRNYMLKMIEFDTFIGMIMTELEERDQLDNTLFVVYPDHFPYMMDFETYTTHIEVEDDIHEVMRQNLLIYATDMTEGTVVSMPGSTMDVTPTLLNLLDSSLEFDYFFGKDLLSDQENYILFSDLTITDGETILYLDETLVGSEASRTALERELEKRINALELQKKILISDYFNNN